MCKLSLVIVTALALGGCGAPMMWTKDGMTAADFEKDRMQCTYEANAAVATYNSGPFSGSKQVYAVGMADSSEFGARQAEQEQLCLRARGYRMAPREAGARP